MIVGAVCLFSQSGLVLDWRPLVCEVGFFMASLFLLIWVLSDEEVRFNSILIRLLIRINS